MKNLIKILFAYSFCFSSAIAQKPNCEMLESLTTKNEIPVLKTTQVFDNNNNLLSTETIQYIGKREIITKVEIEYNTQNREIKRQSSLNNGPKKTITKEYDAQGKLTGIKETSNGKSNKNTIIKENGTEQNFYDEGGAVVAKEVFEKNNNAESTTNYDGKGRTVAIKSKSYTASGKIVESKNEDKIGNVTQAIKYRYDQNENILNEEQYINEEPKSTTEYVYENKLLTKQIKYTKDHQEDYRIEYTYDASKNQNQALTYYKNVLVSKISRTFDKNNNIALERTYDQKDQLVSQTTYKYNCKE